MADDTSEDLIAIACRVCEAIGCPGRCAFIEPCAQADEIHDALLVEREKADAARAARNANAVAMAQSVKRADNACAERAAARAELARLRERVDVALSVIDDIDNEGREILCFENADRGNAVRDLAERARRALLDDGEEVRRG